ncbi:hypothetical protein [Galbibacter pacificus]|uniref:Uncharacterized protein n=1 Tax=Galbibacter pacificus TaxID=2996052 RepID=A0ABT6FNM7_9FLAO|nr:hypothetical protein [Galbibacter pacificus]MDG3581387.1 hypothetical protein [Galbibacter pacificus]MDG3584865.1 hypothetical protein [Galbibacter pacificus]
MQIHKLKGGCKIIGNNIVSVNATEAYNDIGYHAKKNDRLPMVYVDIDDNTNTFSSSSASLELPETTNKIVKVGLYWAATYQYGKGDIKKKENEYMYTNEADRVDDFNIILFKAPDSAYTTVTGKILEDQKDSIGRPYLCYADVTEVLNGSKKTSGSYTVANMRASEGHILGGSSGGWMLMVVYENPEEPLRQIDIYEGFKSVSESFFEVEVDIGDNFNKETDNAQLFLGVLEGDERLKTDEVTIKAQDYAEKKPLYSKVRPQNNFFNSSITYFGEIVDNRNPNSINTLGFDLATMDITKYKSSGSGKLGIKFNSVRDAFLLFFMGVAKEIHANETSVAKQIAVKDTVVNLTDSLKIRESFRIEGISSGYYLVTNVFSNDELASKWKLRVETLGLKPKSFVNPKKIGNIFMWPREKA